MARAKYCVFVGRFQPFHNAHLKVLLRAFEEADHVIVVIGSHRTPLSIKNPWTYEERKAVILGSVSGKHQERMTILPLRDFMYNDIAWITSLQNVVAKVAGNKADTNKSKLIGCFKDDSSYYLNLFPQWELVREPYYDGLDATEIRRVLFENGIARNDLIPPAACDFLLGYLKSDRYRDLKKEYDFLQEYKKKWAFAPFPPVFVTADAVVVKAGHVLLIRRGMNPGKGRIALPGGFISPKETVYQSSLRELKEETKILVPLSELALLEESFYSDHLHMINYFVMGNV